MLLFVFRDDQIIGGEEQAVDGFKSRTPNETNPTDKPAFPTRRKKITDRELEDFVIFQTF